MLDNTKQSRPTARLIVAFLLALTTMLLVSVALPRVGLIVPRSAAWPLLSVSGAVLVYIAFARVVAAKQPERAVVDAEGIRRLRAAEVIESVRWSHLVNVSIATTDEGPFSEDFFWLLRASDGSGCAVGSELAVTAGLLERPQKLPRFNNGALIAASGSTSNALFVCWEGTPGEALVCAQDSNGALPGTPNAGSSNLSSSG